MKRLFFVLIAVFVCSVSFGQRYYNKTESDIRYLKISDGFQLDPKTYEDMQIYVGTKLKEKTWASLSSMDWDTASDKRKFEKLKHLYVGDKSYRNKLIDRYVSSHKDVLDTLWLKQYGAKQ